MRSLQVIFGAAVLAAIGCTDLIESKNPDHIGVSLDRALSAVSEHHLRACECGGAVAGSSCQRPGAPAPSKRTCYLTALQLDEVATMQYYDCLFRAYAVANECIGPSMQCSGRSCDAELELNRNSCGVLPTSVSAALDHCDGKTGGPPPSQALPVAGAGASPLPQAGSAGGPQRVSRP
jgi:hypothetical protein